MADGSPAPPSSQIRGGGPPPPQQQQQFQNFFDPTQLLWCPEDIIFCIDVDFEIESEMKPSSSKAAAASSAVGGGGGAVGSSNGSGAGGTAGNATPTMPPITRLDAVRQALLLYVHSKLAIDSRHRFGVMTLGEGPSWITRQLTNDLQVMSNALRSLKAMGSYPSCDFFSLFRTLNLEAERSNTLGRCLRLILIYSRSMAIPSASAPVSSLPKSGSFIADAIYLHDRPSPDNRPQAIFDVLVNLLEGISARDTYIFESSSGLAKTLFRMACILLSHPLQRCRQDGCLLPLHLDNPSSSLQSPSSTISGITPQL